jgi:uncharacterized protein
VASPDRPPLVVGFDLDMTLLDSRPGIAATLDVMAAETGVPIDSAAAVGRLGPPLDEELRLWFPAEQVEAMADRFRAIYPGVAVEPSPALPGAHEVLAAVHAHGGRTVVITAKYEPNARLHVEHLGLAADELVGWAWGDGKAEAMALHGVTVYVGDHTADMAAAVTAGVLGVGVTTGGISAPELLEAGASVVLDDLAAVVAWLDDFVLDQRLADLEVSLVELGSVLVAFSGGADSAFLLAAAVRALGPYHVVAATAVSSALPESELESAKAFATELGIRHLVPRTYEMAVDGYRANAGDRCYFCKAELLDVLRPVADRLAVKHVLVGTNADDARAGFRPGMRAAAERGAQTPLLDAGLTKQQVRVASHRWGLRTWDKPAAACLSSRIAYGIEITSDRLRRVDRAESGLRSVLVEAGLPVHDLRVRDLGETARVEVDAQLVPLLADEPEYLAAVLAAGFGDVELDPRGFRSGAMNELLADPERYR